MPELGPYGSVRGALSNGCLYRDWVPTPSSAVKRPNHIQTSTNRRRLSVVITILHEFTLHSSRFLENVVV